MYVTTAYLIILYPPLAPPPIIPIFSPPPLPNLYLHCIVLLSTPSDNSWHHFIFTCQIYSFSPQPTKKMSCGLRWEQNWSMLLWRCIVSVVERFVHQEMDTREGLNHWSLRSMQCRMMNDLSIYPRMKLHMSYGIWQCLDARLVKSSDQKTTHWWDCRDNCWELRWVWCCGEICGGVSWWYSGTKDKEMGCCYCFSACVDYFLQCVVKCRVGDCIKELNRWCVWGGWHYHIANCWLDNGNTW